MGRRKENKELPKDDKTEFVNVRLSKELKVRLEDRADREGRSLSNLIRQIITKDMGEVSRAALLQKILLGEKSPAELENDAPAAPERKTEGI